MIFGLLTLLVSLILSGTAAYYSVMGLIAIFPNAVIPVALMGGVLEVSKLLVASWLYRYWNIAPRFLRGYFLFALVTLAFITSMGVFGFLSKSHIESSANATTIQTELKNKDDLILTKRKDLEQLGKESQTLDKVMQEFYNRGQTTKGKKEFDLQKSNREKIEIERKRIEKEILDVQYEKNNLTQQIKTEQAKVGPIRYVAEMILGESDEQALEKSVRYLILTIVFVFDPLAILLVIAANISLTKTPQKDEGFLDIVEVQGKNWKKKKAKISKE